MPLVTYSWPEQLSAQNLFVVAATFVPIHVAQEVVSCSAWLYCASHHPHFAGANSRKSMRKLVLYIRLLNYVTITEPGDKCAVIIVVKCLHIREE